MNLLLMAAFLSRKLPPFIWQLAREVTGFHGWLAPGM